MTRVAVVTSHRSVSLSKVANHIAKVIGPETVVYGYPYNTDSYYKDIDKIIIVMTVDPQHFHPYALLAYNARKWGKKVVFYATIEGRPVFMYNYDWIRRYVDFVANSQYTANWLKSAGLRVLDVVYHGVDIDAIRSQASRRLEIREKLGFTDDFVVLYIAGCYTRKGHDLFAKVINEVVKRDNTVKFIILTKGKCAELYDNCSNTIAFDDFGELKDEDIYAFYHAADLYVQASLSEGFGLPTLEALAAGKLVVHPDYIPLSEITTSKTSVRVPVTHVEFKREGGGIEYELHYYKPEEMADAILYAKDLVMKQRDDIEVKCVRRAKLFDYRKTYTKLYELIAK